MSMASRRAAAGSPPEKLDVRYIIKTLRLTATRGFISALLFAAAVQCGCNCDTPMDRWGNSAAGISNDGSYILSGGVPLVIVKPQGGEEERSFAGDHSGE